MKICSRQAWKSAFCGCTHAHTHTRRHRQAHAKKTLNISGVQRCTFTHSPALYTPCDTQTHTHSESHIAMAWNAFYADWVQALSWSESSLEFDMQLKGAMSFQLGKGACQPAQLPPQSVQLTFILSESVSHSTCVCAPAIQCLYLAIDLMWTERGRKSSQVKTSYWLLFLWSGWG